MESGRDKGKLAIGNKEYEVWYNRVTQHWTVRNWMYMYSKDYSLAAHCKIYLLYASGYS